MNSLAEVTLHDLLLVEDNPTDVLLMAEAFAATVRHARLSHAEDGVAALAFLRRQGQHAAAPRPKLVLLDLNMPRLGGLEVLAELRAELRSLPVLVLSTSQDAGDIERAYALGANAYLTKPRDLPGFFGLCA